MRILITGSSGMLGKEIFNEFLKNDNNVFGVDLKSNSSLPERAQIVGDLTEKKFVLSVLKDIDPDIIIHCAALVNLDTCEKNKGIADKIHVAATKLLSQYKSGSTKLIYISTDSVFDGKKGNYLETDKPNPINYYAKSKLAGELKAKFNSNHIIIRTNIFGFNTPLKGSLAEWAINNLENNKAIKGFTDVVFNAIYTKHLAKIISTLCSIDYKGTINIASANKVSKYEFLRLLSQELNFSKLLLGESTSKDINFTIPRPKITSLNTDKIQKITILPSVEEGIIDLVNDYKKLQKNT